MGTTRMRSGESRPQDLPDQCLDCIGTESRGGTHHDNGLVGGREGGREGGRKKEVNNKK